MRQLNEQSVAPLGPHHLFGGFEAAMFDRRSASEVEAFKAGLERAEAGELSGARARLLKTMTGPGFKEAPGFLLVGLTYLAEGDFEPALGALMKAHDAASDDPRVTLAYAVTLMGTGRYEAAGAQLTAARAAGVDPVAVAYYRLWLGALSGSLSKPDPVGWKQGNNGVRVALAGPSGPLVAGRPLTFTLHILHTGSTPTEVISPDSGTIRLFINGDLAVGAAPARVAETVILDSGESLIYPIDFVVEEAGTHTLEATLKADPTEAAASAAPRPSLKIEVVDE
ncbi:MAG: tetratricopeptide repeat protein [Phycisphaeraceae bacterium]|nr:tetratricopeptide repeat protein [Phycisphaeraceae bacterium]